MEAPREGRLGALVGNYVVEERLDLALDAGVAGHERSCDEAVKLVRAALIEVRVGCVSTRPRSIRDAARSQHTKKAGGQKQTMH
jgi:uncharacterized protein (DUF342 family)